MKTIGLIGGTGWISTVEYYRIINEAINRELGGLNFARCILYSFNYGDIDELNKRNDMQGLLSLVLEATKKIIAAGAECIVLCANTLHYFADQVEQEINVPLIHIATATAKEIRRQNLAKVGLLGTKITMEQDFYKIKLQHERIDTIVPEQDDREFIHQTIMNELLKSIFTVEAKAGFLAIMGKLQQQGAQGIILGCTEIPLLIKPEDTAMPLFHTTLIHSLAAVDFALERNA